MFAWLFLLMINAPPPQLGIIHVFVEPGVEVFVDSKKAGISSDKGGGLRIEDVPLGEHEVSVRTASGGVAKFKVFVAEGEAATVQVSSLGLRNRARSDDADVEMQITSAAPPCDLWVGSDHLSSNAESITMEHIRPGVHRVAVTCGNKTAATELEIPAGRVLTLQADLATAKIRVMHDRPRSTAVQVPTVEDAIMRLELPFSWKRAMAAALVPGVRPKSVSKMGDMRASAEFTAPDRYIAEQYVSRLSDRVEVRSVIIARMQWTPEGATFRLVITFNGVV